MNAKNLREHMHAVPFKPFSIYLPGDKKIHVPHPDFIAISESGRSATVHGPKDEIFIVDVMLITALEIGRVKRRRTANSGKARN